MKRPIGYDFSGVDAAEMVLWQRGFGLAPVVQVLQIEWVQTMRRVEETRNTRTVHFRERRVLRLECGHAVHVETKGDEVLKRTKCWACGYQLAKLSG